MVGTAEYVLEAEPEIVAQDVEPAGTLGNGECIGIAAQDRLEQLPVGQVNAQHGVGAAFAQAINAYALADQAAVTAPRLPAQSDPSARAALNRSGKLGAPLRENGLQRSTSGLRRGESPQYVQRAARRLPDFQKRRVQRMSGDG